MTQHYLGQIGQQWTFGFASQNQTLSTAAEFECMDTVCNS